MFVVSIVLFDLGRSTLEVDMSFHNVIHIHFRDGLVGPYPILSDKTMNSHYLQSESNRFNYDETCDSLTKSTSNHDESLSLVVMVMKIYPRIVLFTKYCRQGVAIYSGLKSFKFKLFVSESNFYHISLRICNFQIIKQKKNMFLFLQMMAKLWSKTPT